MGTSRGSFPSLTIPRGRRLCQAPHPNRASEERGAGRGRGDLLWYQFVELAVAAGTITMYAVFEDGSRQYLVEEGDVVRVDYRDVEEGQEIEFGRVLLYNNEGDTRLGQPLVE